MSATPQAEQLADGQLITGSLSALPTLQVTHLRRGDVLLVQAQGKLTRDAHAAIKAQLEAATGAGVHTVVLDGGITPSVLRPERDDAIPTSTEAQAPKFGDRPGAAAWLTAAANSRDGDLIALRARIASQTPPPIGHPWPTQGGLYAGLARGVDGAPDHHLILANVMPSAPLAWQPAMDWAAGLTHGGFDDWALPTRAESAVLFAHLREQFEPRWHWTSEVDAEDGACAWDQHFDNGFQSTSHESYVGRARAVRRLVLQSFGA